MPDVKPASVSSEDPQTYEDTHVHAVYDEIAPHFSSTRYKPWPIISAFMSSLPTGWIGVDLGTGNGKYLPLPADRPGEVWTIGLDRSLNLLKIAKRAGDVDRDVVWGDVLDNPWRTGVFDYAISIATIHHLASQSRRRTAVQRLLESISPSHGRALVYVWAIEQDQLSKRSLPPGPDSLPLTTTKGQDVYVPWVLSTTKDPKPKLQKRRGKTSVTQAEEVEIAAAVAPEALPPKVFNRYYHMFAQGELRELIVEAAEQMGLFVGTPSEALGGRAGVEVVSDGWERSNYFVELRRWQQ